MIDCTDARQMALSLPEAEEYDHRGHPAFRVRKKIFATLWPSEQRAVLKLALPDQAALVSMDPVIFSLNSWSYQGWTNVDLNHINPELFQQLIKTAWREVAPKGLASLEEQ